ncbi:MAG: response regulator [Bacteroidetes bacterium]|nr:response regulator [Bacteroidota bacterium]
MKILYIEDNSTDTDLTTRKLTQTFKDCEIIHADTLSEARKRLKKDKEYDLALIDMHLPDGNGLEFLVELREKNINCTVIVLTGSGDEESAVAALKAGADDYLTKKTNYLKSLPDSITLAIKNFEKKQKISNRKIAVLYVEHNKSDIELTQRHFKSYAPNFLITAVTSAEEALKKLPLTSDDPCKYCIILLDYRLSGIDALEFVKIIRRERKLAVAIVVVTGQGNEEIAIEALRLGVDEYLVKRPNYLFRLPSLLTSAYQYHELENKQLALEKSEALYRLLVNNSSDVTVILDLNLKQTFVSPAVNHLIGYTPEEAINLKIENVFTPKSLKLVISTFEKEIQSGQFVTNYLTEPVVLELEMFRKDGSTVWTETKASLLFDEKGKPNGVFGVTRDITIRKKALMDLIVAKEKAEESDQLKTAFLNNISHEIRTPMNAIIGFSEFLNDPELSDESRKHFTEVIIKSSNQLLSIVTDIISIATIEAGQEKIHESQVNISNICEIINDQFFTQFQEKNISFQIKNPLINKEILIITDETKLIQVLTNLLSNALKFTKKGHVNFGYEIKDNNLEFFVEDTGIGISPEMAEVIFDRFRQVESNSTREFGGSGLGLTISKAYAYLFGGKIWLKSELGKGSTFYFSIPFKRVIGISSSDELIDEDNKSKQMLTILIAEDEEYNYRLFEVILENLDLNLVWAKDGSETVEICKSNQDIDLVLMDIKMPFLNGYEATQQIRQFNKDIIIIAQTAHALPGDREKALAAGCDDYISKPIDRILLLRMLKKYLKY